MVSERRLARLTEQIKQRVAKILARELSDPRMGFVTVSRVTVDRELEVCKVHWSCLGDEKERRLTQKALDHARGFIQRAVAKTLTTRNAPHLVFAYDESIAGAIRLQELIEQATREDEAHQADRGELPDDQEPQPPKTPDKP